MSARVNGEASVLLPSALRILIAEDNLVNQQLAAAMVERLGYRADVVANGREVLAALSHEAYAAVLMDCEMPELDGFGATVIIRRWERSNRRHTPIIAITAQATKGARERCLAAGMDDYLAKPVSLKELHAVLQRWVAPQLPPGAAGNGE